MDQNELDQQSQHWEKNFSNKPEMFGLEPSVAAIKSFKLFKEENIKKIVELGAGLGRDTIFFAQNSIKVHALDYSPSSIKIIKEKSKKNNLDHLISTEIFDIRKKLRQDSGKYGGCYSHMLYCMALSSFELLKLNDEIYRILNHQGINIYTVRNENDGDYKNGIHRGEDMYENDGFIVHFFSKDKVKSLLKGFKNLSIEKFNEGNFPRKLYFVVNKKI